MGASTPEAVCSVYALGKDFVLVVMAVQEQVVEFLVQAEVQRLLGVSSWGASHSFDPAQHLEACVSQWLFVGRDRA